MFLLAERPLKFLQRFRSWQLLLILGLLLTGCNPDVEYTEPPITAHSLLHEVYDTMTPSGSYGNHPKFYLWKDNVTPSKHYLDSSYTDTRLSILEAGNKLLQDLRYCASSANNRNCEDPFSAVYTKAQIDNLNANLISQSFGFFPDIYIKNGISLFVVIREVLPYSPFSKAGLGRGDRILSFNGLDATDAGNESQIKRNFNDGTYFNQPVNIEWRSKKDNLTYTRSINVSSYTTSDILNTDDSIGNHETDRFHKTIMMVTNNNNPNDVKKVGYLIYKGYTERSKQELKELFAYWNKKSVSDTAIIDLRYNGGGLVSTAQMLISLLTTKHTASDFTTRLLFNGVYSINDRSIPFLSSSKVTLSTRDSYSPQHNFKNLFFLVGGGTASASEMTIIGIKPFVNVVVIGETTAGKGVGQSPYLDRTKKYYLQLINFRYENSRGEKVFRSGIVPDHSIDGEKDNIKPWGHGEPLFDKAVERLFNSSPPIVTTYSPFLPTTFNFRTSYNNTKELNWYKDNYQRLVGF